MKTIAIVALLYNGLLYPEMGPIAQRMEARGQHTQVLWHDQATSLCPRYILGHSMGGLAALAQARRCISQGHPPRLVVTIDAAGYAGPAYCPKGTRCVNYYNPAHTIGFGAKYINGASNHIVLGYSHIQMPYAVQKQVLILMR